DGARQVEVDTFGRVYEVLNEREAIPGNNVVLTIDYDLQKYIADKYNDRRIAVTVLDINDNSILSMYSAPSYDLNMFTPFIRAQDWSALVKNPVKPLLNRNIEGMYPPGSVYKVVMALAGLQEGVITPDTTFRCNGSYRLNSNFSYNCWRKHGHGDVNLRKALSTSCDVYFYNLGRLLEIDKIQKYSNFFSLGYKTGIDLPNEKAAFFPSREWKQKTRKESWFPGETVITSIGQGFMTATPLQIGVMMSGVFNGGNIYKPRIADRIENSDGEEIKKFHPELVRHMDIPEHMKNLIMDGLVDSVYERGGTSYRARVSEVTVGGKTGTAQVVSLKKTEDMEDDEIPEHWRDHSWFTGVFPVEKPRYVIVVMVEHGGSGGASAAPIGGDVIKKMLELGYVSEN
ncbi:MAG: penicillin-binding protein 2, partial [Deferribacterales bacterium]|nr:penicillin-binding protein 2 [Deferribacterales bacterium]